MTPMEIGAILGSVLLTLIGVVWGMLRSDIAELKARVTSAEKENARLVTEHARSEERDKAFEGGIERLTKAIDDFDTRIGKQIDNLSRVVEELAVLPLTMYFDSSTYAVGTWTGKASAGTSGGRNATTAGANPTVGANLNGIPTVAFAHASAQYLNFSYALSTVFTAGAWSWWCLCNQTAAAIGSLFGDQVDGYVDIGTTAIPQFNPLQFNGGYFGPAVASFTSQWQLVQAKYDGTNLKARVNSSAWSSVAVGNIGSLIRQCRIGANYNTLNTFDGLMASMGAAQVAFSDAQFNAIKAALNTRFALAL